MVATDVYQHIYHNLFYLSVKTHDSKNQCTDCFRHRTERIIKKEIKKWETQIK